MRLRRRSRAARPSLRVGRGRHPVTGVADGWSLLRRASFVGAEQNPAYRPARPPLAGPADGAAQLAQRIVELLAAPDCQLILLAVQYTVGEGVFAGCARGIGLLQ